MAGNRDRYHVVGASLASKGLFRSDVLILLHQVVLIVGEPGLGAERRRKERLCFQVFFLLSVFPDLWSTLLVVVSRLTTLSSPHLLQQVRAHSGYT